MARVYNQIIYVDMDGVLTDFRGTVETITGIPLAEFVKIGDDNRVMRRFMSRISPTTFFEDLLPNPHLDELLSVFQDLKDAGRVVNILSANGSHMADKGKHINDSKYKWLKKHIGDKFQFHEVHIVPRSSDKKEWADKVSFLIDDRSHIVKDFIAANGHGYHYDIRRHNEFMEWKDVIFG